MYISVEHVFEVSVETVKGLRLLEDMIWGEADCFVQYHFPCQTQNQVTGATASIMHGTVLTPWLPNSHLMMHLCGWNMYLTQSGETLTEKCMSCCSDRNMSVS